MSQQELAQKQESELVSIVSNYDFVLIDTCALKSIEMPKPKSQLVDSRTNQLRIERYNDERKFLDFLIEGFNQKPKFYITNLILKEIQSSVDHSFKFKQKTKNLSRTRHKEERRKILDLFRLIENERKLIRKFLESFRDNRRIISFNKKELKLYDSFSEDYLKLQQEYELSDADYDFLISGLVFSYTRGPTLLLSNDMKIGRMRRDIAICRDINSSRFGFSVRRNF